MSQETVITPQSLEPVAWWFLFTGIFTDYFVLRLISDVKEGIYFTRGR